MRSQSQSQSRKSESPFNFSIHSILWGHLRNCLQDVSIPRHITNGPLTKPENVGLEKHRVVNNYQAQLSALSLCWYDHFRNLLHVCRFINIFIEGESCSRWIYLHFRHQQLLHILKTGQITLVQIKFIWSSKMFPRITLRR